MHVRELGICPHCREILYLLCLLAEKRKPEEPGVCPGCGKILGPEAFGLAREGENFVRKRWVGENGHWVMKKPERSFTLGGMKIRVEN